MPTTIEDFREEDFDVQPDDVQFGKELGRGNFSLVYKGSFNGNPVAIKKQTIVDPDLEKYLLKELGILRQVEHSFIIKFFGAYRDPNESNVTCILTEYVEGGDLRRLLQEKSTPLGWKFRVKIARDTMEAIYFLHENADVIHRDIKTDNVLLDKDGIPKLCDFGFARKIDRNKQMTMCGTDEFMAPEILFCMPYDEKADIFSFGITLVELITRKPPGKEGTGFLERLPKDGFAVDFDELDRETKAAKSPQSLEVLLKDTLCAEPGERLGAKEVLEWLDDLLKELSEDEEPLPELTEEAISGQLEKYLKEATVPSKSGALGGSSRPQTADQRNRVEDALSQRDVDLRGFSDVDSDTAYRASVASNGNAGRTSGGGGGVVGGGDGGGNDNAGGKVGLFACCFKKSDKIGAAAKAAPDWERMAGWVTKRGGRVKSWKRRYMVITRLGCVYFKGPDEQSKKEAQGSIEFSEMIEIAGVVCNAVPVVMTGKKFSFVVHCMKRDYYMAATSAEERDKWVQALCDGYNAYTNRNKKEMQKTKKGKKKV